MEAEHDSDQIVLLVDVDQDTLGNWRILVNDTDQEMSYAVMPGTFVVRLRQAPETGTLRGVIQLRGSEYQAPIHTNSQLAAMVRHWLIGDAGPAGGQ